MKNDNNNNSSVGIGFCGVLTIVFIILKLCKVISWSWLWVVSPLWISIVAQLALVGIVALIAWIKASNNNG